MSKKGWVRAIAYWVLFIVAVGTIVRLVVTCCRLWQLAARHVLRGLLCDRHLLGVGRELPGFKVPSGVASAQVHPGPNVLASANARPASTIGLSAVVASVLSRKCG
jgi:hypothetical protein